MSSSHVQRSSQIAGLCTNVVYSSSYDPLLDGYQTLLHWLTLLRRFSLLLFGSQGQCQTTGLHLSIVHSIFYEPFA